MIKVARLTKQPREDKQTDQILLNVKGKFFQVYPCFVFCFSQNVFLDIFDISYILKQAFLNHIFPRLPNDAIVAKTLQQKFFSYHLPALFL